MTRLAQRVGRRARLAALCVALALGGVPAHGLASAAPVVAAVVGISSAAPRVDPLPRAAPVIAVPAPVRQRPQRQTANADVARRYAPPAPLFIAHRALLR